MDSFFELANLVLQTACPNNVILLDDKGQPSVMVRIPKMTFAQLGLGNSDAVHPAFIINGKEVNCLYLSKHGNVIRDGCACSLPGVDPVAKIGYYEAMDACTAKGPGWHLMTQAEFSAISQWCVKEGFLPYGNNAEGSDFRENFVKALAVGNGHTLTGSGPLNWYHDRTFAGIADLNGNTSNWMGGIRFVCGELQILPGNDAADRRNDQSSASPLWRAVDGTTGELILPDGNGTTPNSLKLDFVFDTNKTCCWRWITGTIQNPVNNTRNDEFSNIKCDDSVCPAARVLLQAYDMLPASKNPLDYEHNKLHCRNTGADLRIHRGGSFHDYVDSGLYFTRICDTAEHATAGIGFRCAYAEF